MPNNILQDTISRYPSLSSCQPSILEAFNSLTQSFSNNNKLLICGNGGSSSDADHIAGELLKSFRLPRPLPPSSLPTHLQQNLQGALPVIPLSSFPALTSAYANDCHADYSFAQLTHALAQPGDSLLAISTSGNSSNILHAVEYANASNINTIALTGQSGGKLKSLAKISICVPESETFKIQELHLPIYHALSLMLEAHFFSSKNA